MIDQHSIATFAPGVSSQTDSAGGYFAAIRLENFSAESKAATEIYSRKDFYKITLTNGDATYYARGQEYVLTTDHWVLVFSNRDDPYRWEVRKGTCNGYSCMFTDDFLPLPAYDRPSDWPVFNGDSQSVFKLTETDKLIFENIFKKMLDEQHSDYTHKYQLLFLFVLECIHCALKLEHHTKAQNKTGLTRLADAFKGLLAAQFPLLYPHQRVTLRTPQDYADRLAVHTNYLNRALKEVTGRTTTQFINERMMQEARSLLLHSDWPISHIGNSLGFEEATHFTRAFKAYTGHTPSSLR
jgi:AraC-like DNA-binding protein